MKRPPQSFVIEHKRRSRLTKDEPASIWSGDTGRELRGLMRVAAEPSIKEAHLADPGLTATTGETCELASPRRILEVRVEPTIASVFHGNVEKTEPRRRKRSDEQPEADFQPNGTAQKEAHQSSDSVGTPVHGSPPSEDGPAPVAVLPTSRSDKLSYHQRRREARKGLPLAERWRWNRK